MIPKSRLTLALASSAALHACADSRSQDRTGAEKARYASLVETLRPLHRKLGKPRPGDWLLRHKEEGQTFAEYLACKPTLPRGERKVLYILPVGDFTKSQRKIVELAAEFMRLYFNLAVRVQKDVPLAVIPEKARRTHPSWGNKQILSTYVLYDVLKPRLPADAAAYLAFTASDLWPGKGWNFVFGQASLKSRVGVWSIHRNGDPDESDEAYRLCLLRTIKTATHETGHMFSIKHCTAFECNMCGSNNRSESDRRPLALCPECCPKVCWATRTQPRGRFERLAKWCAKQGLTPQAEFYRKSAAAVAARDRPKK